MLLPPCHAFFQFYVINGKLSLQLYQRSADVFLGVPFNIASYSLLLLIIADITGLQPGEFVHTTGDTHIYSNHMDQVDLMLKNSPLKLPQVKFKRKFTSINDIKFDDIELINYKSHEKITAKVAV
jgi:thymidylate synthase